MVTRPWVTPKEIKDYTEKQKVKERTDDKLKIDIFRAEQYVISYTNNHFKDETTIPEAVKTAVILVTEIYSNTVVEGKGEYKSETFDDYSYTTADIATKIENLDLGPLLDEFIRVQPRNGVTMRLRKL